MGFGGRFGGRIRDAYPAGERKSSGGGGGTGLVVLQGGELESKRVKSWKGFGLKGKKGDSSGLRHLFHG